MARFSIIVPGLGNTKSFEETLASVLRYRPDNCQVVVVHRERYDDPYGLGREVDFVDAPSSGHSDGLVGMFNAGVKASRGSLVGFLRPGIQLTERWETPIEQAFGDSNVASVTPAIISVDEPNCLVTAGVQVGDGFSRQLAGVNFRIKSKSCANLKPLGPTSWAAFYRKSYLVSLDECDETLRASYFDLDLALSFSALDFDCPFVPDSRLICENAKEIWDSAKLPHGCSAQRAATRFGSLCSSAPAISWKSSLVRDLFCWPWSWNNLKHQRQRKLAAKFLAADEHYHQLLQLLAEQRARIVAPGLHSRVAAQQRTNVVSQRRAA
jgi:hypothetical protein